MGQYAAAILVGVKQTEDMGERLYNADGESVWEALPYDRHPETGENNDVLGFSVAVSNGANDDEGKLSESTALADFEATYRADVAKARRKWDAFAKWMTKKGHELPEPTLLLTIVERA